MRVVLNALLILLVLLGGVGVAAWWFSPATGQDPNHRDVHRDRGQVEELMTGHAHIQRLDWTRAKVDMANMKTTMATYINMYMIDHGRVPPKIEDLFDYGMSPSLLKDSQGIEIHYEVLDGGQRAKLFAYGPDNTGNTPDDIVVYVP